MDLIVEGHRAAVGIVQGEREGQPVDAPLRDFRRSARFHDLHAERGFVHAYNRIEAQNVPRVRPGTG